MSNTYFTLNKHKFDADPFSNRQDKGHDYDMKLSLTAFVGNPDIVQLTIQTESNYPLQSGTAYYTLNEEEIDRLIGALLERKLRLVTATSNEQSIFNVMLTSEQIETIIRRERFDDFDKCLEFFNDLYFGKFNKKELNKLFYESI